jgi:oligo-alginate lyase
VLLKLKLYFIVLLLINCTIIVAQTQHPIAFATKGDIDFIKSNLKKSSLLKQSYDDIKKSVEEWVGKDVDVPFPKDAAGGYTHDKHKANYTLMFNAGLMYQFTKDVRYANLVKSMFLKYAVLNPTLKNHPQATSSSPGRIFWQALNDANWLVYTGLAFDCIQDYLAPNERKLIEDGAFKPEVDFFTKDLKSWFNLIHNHAVWACAGVGLVGIATDNRDYIEMALYGADKDKKAGFMAQLEGLFSPDGYYTEGPYYTRYAVLPFYLFANGLNNVKPQLKIFEYRDKILKKALDGALQQTNLDGGFYSYNDALKEKKYTSNELVNAINIAWKVYGASSEYLVVAKAQGRVSLSKGGAAIANELLNTKKAPLNFPYKTVEFTDGVNGTNGGVSVLRSGMNKNLTTLIFKYSSHGLSHGHYDKLNINLYDNGNEILQDYGAARFINIEQKYGGRYLPETKTYASQTIAHNTIVVDEKSHYKGIEEISEKHNAFKVFGALSDSVKVVCAKDTTAYNDAILQRSIYMIDNKETRKPLVIDLFNILTKSQHQYDLPFHYLGTFISANFKYTTYTKKQETLGSVNGYQHLWKEGEANKLPSIAQITFLNKETFYTISSTTEDSTKIFFVRNGANDPNFNLRHDPAFIYRKNGMSKVFFNVIEPHGKFDPVAEVSTRAYSSVKEMKILHNTDEYTVVSVLRGDKKIAIAQSNLNYSSKTHHKVILDDGSIIEWDGAFKVFFNLY